MKETSSTQQFVEIEEIKDGVIVLKSGSLRRVLLVSGINFELKSEEEQNIITYAYQNFLNSLDFSVQFVVHSRRLSIKDYLEKLSNRREEEANELLKNQIGEYIEFIRSFVESNEIMRKTFFVVVPYDSITIPRGGRKLFSLIKPGKQTQEVSAADKSFDQKIIQLNQRVDQVTNGLIQIGLRVVALNDEELIELFYNLYNPESVEKENLRIASGEA